MSSSSASNNLSDISTSAMLAEFQKRAEKMTEAAQHRPATLKESENQLVLLKRQQTSIRGQLQALLSSTSKLESASTGNSGDGALALAASKSLNQAYQSIKQAISRSETIIQASQLLPSHRRRTIQVLFCLDATSSMQCGDIISKLKDTIDQLHVHLEAKSCLNVEVGFVAFRDYDDTPRFEHCDFTSDSRTFRNALAKVRPSGGADEAEDVLGALDFALNESQLSWKPCSEATHIIVFSGDAPGHGLWNKSCGRPVNDSYPNGDKFGLTVPKISAKLLRLQAVVAYLRVNDTTDHMMRMFESELVAGGGFPIVTENYRDVESCRDKINNLLYTSSSVSHSFTGGGLAHQRHNHIGKKRGVPAMTDAEKRDPSLAATIKLRGRLLVHKSLSLSTSNALETATRILASKDPVADLCSSATHSGSAVQNIEVNVTLPYFSAGGVRFAHHASVGKDADVVAKDFQIAELNHFANHANEFRSTLIAHALSFLFCGELGIPHDLFQYLDTQIFQVDTTDALFATAKKQHPDESVVSACYSLERFVRGDFKKMNNNVGWMDNSFELAQAFSHFTYHVCDGKMMVLDVQGFFDPVKKSYLLTDPAIMTENIEMLPSPTNGGRNCMMSFLKSHKCGRICKRLGIVDVLEGSK